MRLHIIGTNPYEYEFYCIFGDKTLNEQEMNARNKNFDCPDYEKKEAV